MIHRLKTHQLALLIALGWSAAALAGEAATPLPPLRVQRGQFTDPAGKPVALRGVNLGNWLVLESHFSGLNFPDELTLWSDLQTRLGPADTGRVREAWRAAWITADDFQRVRQLGLNHVRVPFGWWLLEDERAPGKYLANGWAWLDRVVMWSEQAGIYCVLDLHGAPGGQSDTEHTGQRGRNALWSDPQLQRRAADLWEAIARRYRGRNAIAAFDLLNEPMGAPGNEPIAAVQLALAEAVNRGDPTRIVILEDGYRGLDKLSKAAGKFSSLLAVSAHVYPTINKSASAAEHEAYFRDQMPVLEREVKRIGAPFYVGEWSIIQEQSGGEATMRRHVAEMDRRGWSWAVWLYKQVNRDPVQGYWGFYRNAQGLDLPDFAADSADQLIAKISKLRTENLQLCEPMARTLHP